jgi:hypothetical protein
MKKESKKIPVTVQVKFLAALALKEYLNNPPKDSLITSVGRKDLHKFVQQILDEVSEDLKRTA